MFEPNIATVTRPLASGPAKMRINDSPTSRSLTLVPSRYRRLGLRRRINDPPIVGCH